MHLHSKLINSLGRTNDTAKALGVAPPHISKWKRGGIPSKYTPALVNYARSLGIEPTLQDFFDV